MMDYGEFWVGPTSVGPNPLPFRRVDGKARLKSDLPDSQLRAITKRFGINKIALVQPANCVRRISSTLQRRPVDVPLAGVVK